MNPPEPSIGCVTSDGVATVTLHHPAKRNAMTAPMWRRLTELLGGLAEAPSVRALVLTGSGETFCAGADISTLHGDPDAEDGPQRLAVAAEEALAAFPRPTLAAVRGHCVGGGCQLAAACDLRFATADAVFGVTPARLGVVYPATSTGRLVRLVGPSAAKHLLFSAELIDAERALRVGLVDEVLESGTLLDARVAEFTRTLGTRSLLSQCAAKEYVDGPPDPTRSAHWVRQARNSGEAAEGAAAFLERRPPRFTWEG
ncbi:enoyl-CoA hydratase/isomerase family protein [Streptomyces sp. 549]|uniref:enoyl-CoA hydratase/isomerase family protein n=1 Tax=Streptomyces sp. 549 TaxID=3049076 RepID=UPI0024C2F6F5|nr:enoyl-CoA hydratase/isomerase family protein [Streptomyces sp. 549]MDK1472022.1 enoyl-CoA hydratase/isomerase family protein [Streptomyces sp. 549]